MKILFIVLFLQSHAMAEYRAFELVIKNSVTGQERVVLSNLDPDQYRGYHSLELGEQISYRATWMCKGNTANKSICPKPEKKPTKK
jgi:hypothetical protein